ncbi:MAG: hypothetical protein ACRC62_15455 [Microcoleus sp.]
MTITQTRRKTKTLAAIAPDYEALPYWAIAKVPADTSLGGSEDRYRVVLRHDKISRPVPIQFSCEEAQIVLRHLQDARCDWRLNLDGDGQLISGVARAIARDIVEAVVGTEEVAGQGGQEAIAS